MDELELQAVLGEGSYGKCTLAVYVSTQVVCVTGLAHVTGACDLSARANRPLVCPSPLNHRPRVPCAVVRHHRGRQGHPAAGAHERPRAPRAHGGDGGSYQQQPQVGARGLDANELWTSVASRCDYRIAEPCNARLLVADIPDYSRVLLVLLSLQPSQCGADLHIHGGGGARSQGPGGVTPSTRVSAIASASLAAQATCTTCSLLGKFPSGLATHGGLQTPGYQTWISGQLFHSVLSAIFLHLSRPVTLITQVIKSQHEPELGAGHAPTVLWNPERC